MPPPLQNVLVPDKEAKAAHLAGTLGLAGHLRRSTASFRIGAALTFLLRFPFMTSWPLARFVSVAITSAFITGIRVHTALTAALVLLTKELRRLLHHSAKAAVPKGTATCWCCCS
jgi:hypothetical protein